MKQLIIFSIFMANLGIGWPAALAIDVRINLKLGIAKNGKEKLLEGNVTPSSVFREVIQSNQQLYQMLERQFSPGDVYHRYRRRSIT